MKLILQWIHWLAQVAFLYSVTYFLNIFVIYILQILHILDFTFILLLTIQYYRLLTRAIIGELCPPKMYDWSSIYLQTFVEPFKGEVELHCMLFYIHLFVSPRFLVMNISPINKMTLQLAYNCIPRQSRGYLGFGLVTPPPPQRFSSARSTSKTICPRPFKFGMWVYMGNVSSEFEIQP